MLDGFVEEMHSDLDPLAPRHMDTAPVLHTVKPGLALLRFGLFGLVNEDFNVLGNLDAEHLERIVEITHRCRCRNLRIGNAGLALNLNENNLLWSSLMLLCR